MKISNNKGFTFIEIMIASAILGGIGAFFVAITKESNKTNLKFKSDIEATSFANEIAGHLADPQVCNLAANLGAKSVSGLPSTTEKVTGITGITRRDGTIIYSTSNTTGYGASNLVIESYKFEDRAGDDVDSQTAPRSLFLIINFKKQGLALANSQIKRKIKINFQTDTGNTGTNIAFCKAVVTGYDGVWSRNNNDYNDIFFPGTFVGISNGSMAINPDAFLHVQNSANTGASVTAEINQPSQPAASAQILKFGVDATNNYNAIDFRFYYVSSGSDQNRLDFGFQGQTPRFSIRADGRVGIGNTTPNSGLDVTSGGIRARGGAPGANGVNNNGYAFRGTGDSDSGMFSSADGQLEFYNNSAESMRITSAGSVGIGTTSPTYKLEVNGSAGVKGDLHTGATSGTTAVEVGGYKTANGDSVIILHAQPGSIPDLRVKRFAGPNGNAEIVNQGTGNFTIGNNAGTALTVDSSNNVTGNFRTIIGAAGSDTNGRTSFGGLGIYANDVSTKKWMQGQLNDVLTNASPQDLNGILANYANYYQSNLMGVIKNAVCNNARIITNSISYNGVYNAGTGVCEFTIPNYMDCRVSGNCATLYATTMYATNVWANSFCANGSAGVCVSYTARYRCPDGYYMQGIEYGLPRCWNPWTTGVTGPYAY